MRKATLMQKIPLEARYEKKKALNTQRTADFKNGSYESGGGVANPRLLR